MYLGIDVGTQSVKALLYDAQSQRVADSCSAPLELISDSSGTREQEAQWWLDALAVCLQRLGKAQLAGVRAIGVSGQQHGFVPLGNNGQVLAPVKLWCDTATTAECEQISQAFGGEQRCIEAVGNPILPGYTASKILWLKHQRPDAYEMLDTILLPHDYINFYLTGEKVAECGDASGTGLFDVRNRVWHDGILRALDDTRDLRDALPPLADWDAPIGSLRQELATEFGFRPGIVVSAGGGDNMMAALGTGNVAARQLTVSLGTSGTLFTSLDKPVVDPRGEVAAFCSSTGGWLPLLCTMNCTVATELTRSLFDLSLEGFEAAIVDTTIGANGVVTVPFFNGERTPNLPTAQGSVFGLNPENYEPQNLLRSAMESAVFGLRGGLSRLQSLGCTFDTVRLTGGGAKSATWRQMVADVLALPVTVQVNDEGAAMGAAMQAMFVEQGRTEDLQQLLDEHLLRDEARATEPEHGAVEQYDEYYASYQKYVSAVETLYS